MRSSRGVVQSDRASSTTVSLGHPVCERLNASMKIPIPDDLPQIGPGTRALLRSKGYFTNRDILFEIQEGRTVLETLPGIGPARAALLREWASNSDPNFSRLFGCALLMPGILQAYLSDPDPPIRQFVAINPGATDTLLEALATDADPSVRKAVARRATGKLRETLAADADGSVRSALAAEQGAQSEELAQELSYDSDPGVRSAIALRATDEELLARLSIDQSVVVRAFVARNSNAPESLLTRLVGDVDPSVREAAAANDRTPTSCLEKLLEDNDRRTFLRAKENLHRRGVRVTAEATRPDRPKESSKEPAGCAATFVIMVASVGTVVLSLA